MSDFLVNLLRRGAGLPPLIAPRRPELPEELPLAEGEEPEDREAPGFLAAVRPPGQPAPAARPVSLAKQTPREERAAVAAHAGTDRRDLKDSKDPKDGKDEKDDTENTDRTAAAVPAPALPRRRAVERAPAAAPVTGLSPQAQGEAVAQPLPAEITVGVAHLPATGEQAAEAVEAPMAPPAPEPPTPHALASLSPLPEPPVPPPLPSAQEPEEPRIEVRIGRIEIRQAPPPPAQLAPIPRREPRGFREHSLARSYLDRRS